MELTISSKQCSIVLDIVKLIHFHQAVSKLSFLVMNEIWDFFHRLTYRIIGTKKFKCELSFACQQLCPSRAFLFLQRVLKKQSDYPD